MVTSRHPWTVLTKVNNSKHAVSACRLRIVCANYNIGFFLGMLIKQATVTIP